MIESILLKEPLDVEEIVVTNDEVVVDKYNYICRVNQTDYSSVSLTCEAGASKYFRTLR